VREKTSAHPSRLEASTSCQLPVYVASRGWRLRQIPFWLLPRGAGGPGLALSAVALDAFDFVRSYRPPVPFRSGHAFCIWTLCIRLGVPPGRECAYRRGYTRVPSLCMYCTEHPARCSRRATGRRQARARRHLKGRPVRGGRGVGHPHQPHVTSSKSNTRVQSYILAHYDGPGRMPRALALLVPQSARRPRFLL
jgi:hypothetical protein